jgi:hypothetical protein
MDSGTVDRRQNPDELGIGQRRNYSFSHHGTVPLAVPCGLSLAVTAFAGQSAAPGRWVALTREPGQFH